MGFQLSPGVRVSEIDLTTIVPAVATTAGGVVIASAWGPAEERVLVDTEKNLLDLFGKPDNDNFERWFTANNFLGYGNNLQVVRAVASDAKNASATGTFTGVIKNEADYENTAAVDLATGGEWIAKYPSSLGNSLAVHLVDGKSTKLEFTDSTVYVAGEDFFVGDTVEGATVTDTAVVVAWTPSAVGQPGSRLLVEPATGTFVVGNTVTGTSGLSTGNEITIASPIRPRSEFDLWGYKNLFTGKPETSDFVGARGGENDELHLVVVDKDGLWTGEAGTVLERFEFLSKASDARRSDGSNQYYRDVINETSAFVWFADFPTGSSFWGDPASTLNVIYSEEGQVDSDFSGGDTGAAPTDADILTAYDLFADPEKVDISLLLAGPASPAVATGVIDIATSRKDCIAFVSPERDDVVNNSGDELTDVLDFRDQLTSTSYAVLDSGWKFQYDKFNDVNRFVPLNGDVAGLVVRTDSIAEPWFSPAGFNRGQIRNVIRLAFNPGRTQRDELYQKGVDPVVSFPGEGTVLFGDKTLLSRPSAFDRINVRRLFIVLEKSISIAAKFSLFEFNDEFTRSQFRQLVEPFLREVQGRRGITDFKVVCDETNNTPEVIDANEFVADIFIKPTRSINFIQLNFIAARTSADFNEIGG